MRTARRKQVDRAVAGINNLTDQLDRFVKDGGSLESWPSELATLRATIARQQVVIDVARAVADWPNSGKKFYELARDVRAALDTLDKEKQEA